MACIEVELSLLAECSPFSLVDIECRVTQNTLSTIIEKNFLQLVGTYKIRTSQILYLLFLLHYLKIL